MWELDYKESWAPKNWCFWTAVLEKTFESPLDCKEIKPVHPKGNQSWIFTRRTDAEAEAPILWPPNLKNWLIGKDPDSGKDWRQEEKRMTEDEMIGWHHWFNGQEFEQALGVGDGQGRLACCSPWDRKELDMTEQLNWTETGWSKKLLMIEHIEARDVFSAKRQNLWCRSCPSSRWKWIPFCHGYSRIFSSNFHSCHLFPAKID